MQVDLSKPCTHAAFGQLVGISKQAVGALLERGTLTRGANMGDWLLEYCGSQREQNAGNADGETLAYERAVATRVARERDEIRLAVDRQEYAPVNVLQQALATLGTVVVTILQPLHLTIQRRCPALTPADVVMIQAEVAKACAAAEATALQVFQPKAEEDQEQPAEEVPA